MASEKPFKPSPFKLKKAREQGKVLKSQQLSSAALIIVLIIVGTYTLKDIWVRLKILLEYCIVRQIDGVYLCLSQATGIISKELLVFLLLAAGTAILLEVIQVGPQFRPALALPKAERLNLFTGIKKLASKLFDTWIKFLFVVLILILAIGFFGFKG